MYIQDNIEKVIAFTSESSTFAPLTRNIENYF